MVNYDPLSTQKCEFLYAVVKIVIKWHLAAVSYNSGAKILQKSRSYLNTAGARVW